MNKIKNKKFINTIWRRLGYVTYITYVINNILIYC